MVRTCLLHCARPLRGYVARPTIPAVDRTVAAVDYRADRCGRTTSPRSHAGRHRRRKRRVPNPADDHLARIAGVHVRLESDVRSNHGWMERAPCRHESRYQREGGSSAFRIPWPDQSVRATRDRSSGRCHSTSATVLAGDRAAGTSAIHTGYFRRHSYRWPVRHCLGNGIVRRSGAACDGKRASGESAVRRTRSRASSA